MHLFVDISSHGFGHLAITAPVLNALGKLQPDLQLTVRSGLPARSASQATMVRDGGVFRYCTTCGSMPTWRISSIALRDVPQAGL